MEQVRRRGLEVVLGIALSVVLLGSVVVIWKSFRGNFSDKVTVSAELSQAGDALEIGDIVTYKDVIIGEVTSSSGSLDGSAVATLKIDPKAAAVIPASVKAIAVPQSLFGLTKIQLVPPIDLDPANPGPMLRDGAHVAADRSPAAESLQTALANAYTLLTSVHPADLDAALSSLATALDGQGENLGKLVISADRLLRQLAPHLPELDDVVRSLATVTDNVARNAPALLSSLRDTLVVSRGILRQKQAVAGLLDIAPTVVKNAQVLFNQANVNHAVTIFRDQVGVTAAFAAQPDSLPKTLDGFRQFAETFSKITGSGPYAKAELVLTGANFGEVFNAIVGGEGHVFDSITDPPQYTNADCPRFPGADGPNCGAGAGANGSTARLLATGADYGGTSSSVGSEAEQFAVRAAASSITGVPVSMLPPSITDLLLGPLLRGLSAVIP